MDVFGALADPIRRDLLTRLVAGEARAGDLADEHPVSRPAVSRHLRILREAGLVRATERGRERHYALDPAPLGEVASLLERLGQPVVGAVDVGADRADRAPRPSDRGAPPIGDHHLDALSTETRRAARDRRDPSLPHTDTQPDQEDIAWHRRARSTTTGRSS